MQHGVLLGALELANTGTVRDKRAVLAQVNDIV